MREEVDRYALLVVEDLTFTTASLLAKNGHVFLTLIKEEQHWCLICNVSKTLGFQKILQKQEK
jgi:hypothetical protein